MSSKSRDLEWTFKALAYRKRLDILNLLLRAGPLTVGEVSEVLGIPLNTASRHLGVLARAGLVTGHTTRRYVRYAVPRVNTRRNRLLTALVREAFRPRVKRRLAEAVLADMASGTVRNTMRAIHRQKVE